MGKYVDRELLKKAFTDSDKGFWKPLAFDHGEVIAETKAFTIAEIEKLINETDFEPIDTSDVELLPCPCCGGKAKFDCHLHIEPLIDENGAYVDYEDMYYWEYVCCTECGLEIRSDDEDEAEGITIQKWNRRT